MLQTPESLDLITRYLNNPSNQELQTEISIFRSASAENEAYFIEIENIWERSVTAGRLEEIDATFAVKKLKRKLNPHVTVKSSAFTWFKGIAASILLIAMGYWAYNQSTKPTFIIKTTAKNQIDSVKLTDGSVVILAENTEIKYPDLFGSGAREIFLSKGKAFFKIAKDAKHPFKVVMNQSNVVVLGTSFNIKLTNTTIELGVKTGRVMFSPYHDGATSILTAGQALSYNVQKRELITKTAENADSWLTKELVFVDTPLEEVCKQLTIYFGTDIELHNTAKKTKKLNATFKNQSLDQVLGILNETYSIKINKTNNEINLITP